MEHKIKFPSIENKYLIDLLNDLEYEIQQLKASFNNQHIAISIKKIKNIKENIMPFIDKEVHNYRNWYEINEQRIMELQLKYEKNGQYFECVSLEKHINHYLWGLNVYLKAFVEYLHEFNSIVANNLERIKIYYLMSDPASDNFFEISQLQKEFHDRYKEAENKRLDNE